MKREIKEKRRSRRLTAKGARRRERKEEREASRKEEKGFRFVDSRITFERLTTNDSYDRGCGPARGANVNASLQAYRSTKAE